VGAVHAIKDKKNNKANTLIPTAFCFFYAAENAAWIRALVRYAFSVVNHVRSGARGESP
jgi:hypothetical protein